MNSAKARLTRQLGYVYLELGLEEALRVLSYFRDKRGRSEDVEDSVRILENFDYFYAHARKKLKEYVAPRKSEADLLAGRVTVDKIKLEVDGTRRVTIVFDKRVRTEEVIEALKSVGLEFEVS